MAFSRRVFLAGLLTLLTLLAPAALAHPGKHRHRHGPKRPRIRRRRVRRRRTRRRVRWRVVRGRRRLIVPAAVAVGWEIVEGDKVMVVREVHEHRIVVEHSDGTIQEIEVEKDDTPENTEDLEGSEYEVEVE